MGGLKNSRPRQRTGRWATGELVYKRLQLWHHMVMTRARLRIGTFTPSLLIDLARSTGRLDRADLEVTEIPVPSSPAQFRSLETGEFDVVMTSPDNVLAYRFLSANPLGRNLPVEILAGIDRGLGLSLCLAPSVTDVADVRDRVVGVDVPGSGFAFVAFALLERAGLRPDDYKVESLGSTPRRAAALTAGTCAATVLNAGNELRAGASGCRVVSTVADIGPYLGTVMAALPADDATVAGARKRLAEAVIDTAHDIVTGGLRREVLEAAGRLLGLEDPQALAHLECLLDRTHGLITDGNVDEASINTLIDLRRRHSPSPDLDVMAAGWPTMVDAAALGTGPRA
jgi:ABC-type nitrate/sulfonate/bicarbonate transport system substrate-binding protein